MAEFEAAEESHRLIEAASEEAEQRLKQRILDIRAEQVAKEALQEIGWIFEGNRGGVYAARRMGSATLEERQQAASVGSLIHACESANDRRTRDLGEPTPVVTGLMAEGG